MGEKAYFALGALAVVVGIFVLTYPLSFFVLAVAINDLLGVPCGGLC